MVEPHTFLHQSTRYLEAGQETGEGRRACGMESCILSGTSGPLDWGCDLQLTSPSQLEVGGREDVGMGCWDPGHPDDETPSLP